MSETVTNTTDTTNTKDIRLSQRIMNNPRPALLWTVGILALVIVEFGALARTIIALLQIIATSIPGNPGASILATLAQYAADIPTLLSREIFPNRGYYNGEMWVGTFLGLQPKYAWLFRFTLVYVYSFVWVGWVWVGYKWFRKHYRYADWTPRDDMADRLRSHRWGQFGFIVVFLFIVLAIFAPVMGPTTFQKNINDPFSYQTKYYDESTDSVQSIKIGNANLQSSSGGAGENVGIWTYDDFGRFHPFGTLTTGTDLFTFLAYGARISLLIGIGSIAVSGFIAIAFSMITSYYKGLADYIVVFTSDSIQALPLLLILILCVVVFRGSWIASLYNGAILLIGIFSFFYWPFFWRAIRGPALQISEETWIDAAKSYGQTPRKIMEKHMAPYVLGYLLIYASMSIGGVIISIAALSYLGLGISPPTPEWGRAVAAGKPYVTGASWHMAFIPGVLITLVVLGFNALGDGIRDAIDPQSVEGEGGSEAAIAGGGG